jgi:hypothetical protein
MAYSKNPETIKRKLALLQLELTRAEAVEAAKQKGTRREVSRNGRKTWVDLAKIPESYFPPRLHDNKPKIYLIHACGTQRFKIGTTVGAIATRCQALQSASPVDLEVIGWCPGGVKLERELHKRLQFYRRHGEWFELPDRIVWWLLGHFGRLSKPRTLQLITTNRPLVHVLYQSKARKAFDRRVKVRLSQALKELRAKFAA